MFLSFRLAEIGRKGTGADPATPTLTILALKPGTEDSQGEPMPLPAYKRALEPLIGRIVRQMPLTC